MCYAICYMWLDQDAVVVFQFRKKPKEKKSEKEKSDAATAVNRGFVSKPLKIYKDYKKF